MAMNNIASDFWNRGLNKAKEIASGETMEKFQNWWTANMVQPPEELARIGRDTMQAQQVIRKNVDMSMLDDMYARMDKVNADSVTNFNQMKQNLKANNISEAKKVADRFEDKAFLEYLNDVEAKTNSAKEYYQGIHDNDVEGVYVSNFSMPKMTKNFISDDQEQWIGGKAYKLQGYLPQHYFRTSDPKVNQRRLGVTAAGYAGSAMLIRGIQGGTPITNEYGERDIAGIPFI